MSLYKSTTVTVGREKRTRVKGKPTSPARGVGLGSRGSLLRGLGSRLGGRSNVVQKALGIIGSLLIVQESKGVLERSHWLQCQGKKGGRGKENPRQNTTCGKHPLKAPRF